MLCYKGYMIFVFEGWYVLGLIYVKNDLSIDVWGDEIEMNFVIYE